MNVDFTSVYKIHEMKYFPPSYTKEIWLVVWNMNFNFPISWEFHIVPEG